MGYHNVFVYGTLKGMDKSLGFKSRFVGRGRTKEGNYAMWGGGFPCVEHLTTVDGAIHQAGHVRGELHVVNDDVLAALDRYEGAPSFYEAEDTLVVLEDGMEVTAKMYVGRSVLSSVSHRPVIQPEGGDLYWPFSAEHKEDYANDTTDV